MRAFVHISLHVLAQKVLEVLHVAAPRVSVGAPSRHLRGEKTGFLLGKLVLQEALIYQIHVSGKQGLKYSVNTV